MSLLVKGGLQPRCSPVLLFSEDMVAFEFVTMPRFAWKMLPVPRFSTVEESIVERGKVNVSIFPFQITSQFFSCDVPRRLSVRLDLPIVTRLLTLFAPTSQWGRNEVGAVNDCTMECVSVKDHFEARVAVLKGTVDMH